MKTYSELSPSQLFRDLTTFGSLIFYCLILLLTLALRKIALFYQLFFGLLFIMFVSFLARMLYFKNRPQKQPYRNLIEKLSASAFPSIHAARIIFLTLIGIFFYQNLFLTLLFILLALLTAYSRVYLKKHDWIDLAGGAVLAIITFVITSFL